MLQSIDRFHKTMIGYLLFGVVELAVAYGFVSLAIDRGSFLYYALTLIFLFGALQNLAKCIGKGLRDFKPAKTRRH